VPPGPAKQIRLNQVQDAVPRLQAEIDFRTIQLLSGDQILSEARDLYAHWPQLEQTEKRQIIERLAERITIDKDEVGIDLFFRLEAVTGKTRERATQPQGFRAPTSLKARGEAGRVVPRPSHGLAR